MAPKREIKVIHARAIWRSLRGLRGAVSPMPRGAAFLIKPMRVQSPVVLNLAEWTSADAHHAALKPVDFGQGGSLGESAEWRATRSHPGITPDHEVARYELVGSAEPGS
jgi:hypothetical protein